jgi:NTP pyrophosphatase (non-canonical NTP hydrolase)
MTDKMYYLYHIPGKKIGVTTDLEERVEHQQGYNKDEYQVIMSTTDIDLVSQREIALQKALGYRVDRKLYKDLYKPVNQIRINNMRINVTEMTTTFPCPVNKLKGQLMDKIGMQWETDSGPVGITSKSIDWIMDNVKSSQFTNDRCYVYNKAFARWFDNHDAYGHHELDNAKQMNKVEQKRNGTLTGGLAPTGIRQQKYCDESCSEVSMFELIRQWADERGLYDKGDPKTQALKLVEEVGETCRAILKGNDMEAIDGIGDCVVVLTNLAELIGEPIEQCIEQAYFEIKDRKGKMENGTFKKD